MSDPPLPGLRVADGFFLFTFLVVGLCVALAMVLRRDRARAQTHEAALRTLLEALPIGVVIAGEDGELRQDNAAHRALWGLPENGGVHPRPPGDFKGWQADTDEPIACDRWAYARAVRGEVVSGELIRYQPFHRPEQRFYLSNAAPIRGNDGEVVGSVAVELDVTERRAGEEAARRLLATLDLGAFVARDLDGTIRHWSAGCERLYGWTAAEAVGENAHALLRTRFPVPLAAIEEALRGTGTWRGDLRHMAKGGGALIVSVDMALRRGELAREGAVLEAITDVTEHRRAEAALAESEGRLRALAESLEDRVREEVRARHDAQGRLARAEKLSALGQLAGGIAHDFNNLLQGIGSAAELIGHGRHDIGKVGRLARMVADTAARGATITGRLLAYAKRSDLRTELIEPEVFLAGMSELLRHSIGTSVAVEFEPVIGDGIAAVPTVEADRGQLEAALINLATNARDAAAPDGTVVLSVCLGHVLADGGNPASAEAVGSQFRPGDYVGLVVTDRGSGMTPEVLARVSEPFFTTKMPGKGIGLGLAMARGFSEQSRGGLTIESRAGLGTRAALWFPAALAGVAALRDLLLPDPAPGNTLALGSEPASRTAPARAHVLLVDDDDLVRAGLESQLRMRGFDVRAAGGARAALACLAGIERFDLLLTDYAMPGTDGLGLIAEAQLLRPGLPAILLTGFVTDDAELAMEGATSGAFSLLRKPVTGQALSDQIDAALGTALPQLPVHGFLDIVSEAAIKVDAPDLLQIGSVSSA